MVRQMEGAIGYVELIYAEQNKIPYGSVQNAKGKFVKADLESTTAAAAAVAKTCRATSAFPSPMRQAPDAYPISSFTWLLIPAQSKDQAKGKIIHDFLVWMLGSGQAMTKDLTYAPLPEEVNKRVQAAIAQVK